MGLRVIDVWRLNSGRCGEVEWGVPGLERVGEAISEEIVDDDDDDDDDDEEREGVIGAAEGMTGVAGDEEGRPRSCAAWETDFSHFTREWRSRWSLVRTILKSLSRIPIFAVMVFLRGVGLGC